MNSNCQVSSGNEYCLDDKCCRWVSLQPHNLLWNGPHHRNTSSIPDQVRFHKIVIYAISYQMHRTIGNYILIPHKLRQLFVQYRPKKYCHQLGTTLFRMVKLAKIGYVRVRSERHLTVSHKMKISFSATVPMAGHYQVSF